MFKYVGNFISDSQPVENKYIGTDNEAYTIGEVVTFSSGKLTKAGLDSDTKNQDYVTIKAQGAESTAETPIPVKKTTKYDIYETKASGQITAVGSAYELNEGADGITTTTTKGVFTVIETDGATESTVKGYFLYA